MLLTCGAFARNVSNVPVEQPLAGAQKQCIDKLAKLEGCCWGRLGPARDNAASALALQASVGLQRIPALNVVHTGRTEDGFLPNASATLLSVGWRCHQLPA